MSGGASVPLAFLALYAPEAWQRYALASLSVFCFASAVYMVWRDERIRAIRLEDRLRPRLEIMIEKPERCHDCTGLSHIRLGIWNPSDIVAEDVHVFVESVRPGYPGGLRELRWVGELLGHGETFPARQEWNAHKHVEFLSRVVFDGGSWRLEAGLPMGLPIATATGEWIVRILVQARNMIGSVRADVTIDPGSVALPIRSLDPVADVRGV
jgi:hypothetical protein